MRYLVITLLAAVSFSCSTPATPVSQNPANSSQPERPSERPQTAIAHGPHEGTPPPSELGDAPKSKWTQSGDPIDTKVFDTAIATAEKALAAKPADAAAKKAVADAYYKRAVALTDARQYASALGDYRRTVKHDPSNTEAAEWIERIVSIYASINRGSPKEGEEPPPLPFKKTP
jgi:hypothetical protein